MRLIGTCLGVGLLVVLCGCGNTQETGPESGLELGRTSLALERCTGGTDDDLDGLVDCVDPDCSARAACRNVQSCEKAIFQTDGESNVLKRANTEAEPFTADNLGNIGGSQANGGGYNPRDGYFYMIGANGAYEDHLLRIDAQGDITDLGAVGLPAAAFYNAGDVDDRNRLWTKGANSDTAYRIDLTGPTYTAVRVSMNGLRGADIVYDRDLEAFHGIGGNTVYTYRLSTRGTTTTAITGATEDSSNAGAIWTDADGRLYAFDNQSGRVRRVDPTTGAAVFVGSWVVTKSNDGASCSYALPPFEQCRNGIDDDGDGDVDETRAGFACVTVRDTDDDGVPNGDDLDDDNDGVPDVYESGDRDADGVTDRLDLDRDNDGINDVIEAGLSERDADADGILDGAPAAFGTNGLLDALETAADSAVLDYTENDTDGDGVKDGAELDSDGDGLSDLVEAGYASATVDADDDSTVDDGTDADADGIQDLVDGKATYGDANGPSALPDADGDGTPDYRDPDSDGDGVCDGAAAAAGVCQAGPDTDRTNPSVCADTDGDGCDDCSNGPYDPSDDGTDSDGDGTCDVSEDKDGDGVRDSADLDDDNDGAMDASENGRAIAPDADADSDGVPNYLDKSNQGDGVLSTCADADGNDVCDALSSLFDEDGDGVPNHLDLDADNDGIADVVEHGYPSLDTDADGMVDGPYGANGLADAVETRADSGQAKAPLLDTDGDNTPDARDLDSDADGVFDIKEVPALSALDGDDDGRVDDTTDDDRDGLMEEVDARDGEYGFPKAITDPRAADSDDDDIPNPYDRDDEGGTPGDSDEDEQNDALECPNGWPCADGDSDGTPDYMTADEDGDGVTGDADLDDDGDGILDTQENTLGLDPSADLDDDGVWNLVDANDRGDGQASTCADDDPADGVCDTLSLLFDRDGDGVANHRDLDSDDDSIFDADESGHAAEDENRDGRVDGPVGTNGVADVVETAPDSGMVSAPRNTDSDDEPDFLDRDSDADGVFDVYEAGDANTGTLPRDNDADDDPNFQDADDDGDGIPTQDESPDPNADGNPSDARDSDGEAPPDYLDADDDNDGIPTAQEREDETDAGGDVDGDGLPAWLDTDSDDDGIDDSVEGEADVDGDGVTDYLDPQTPGAGLDSDGDGLLDSEECAKTPCPDTDGDGDPDNLDPDDDGDGVNTDVELPEGDTDGDGKPDYLDADDDGDGIPTRDEPGDADGNGTPDRLEPNEVGTLAGGALCSASVQTRSQNLNMAWCMVGLAALCWRRRRGSTAA